MGRVDSVTDTCLPRAGPGSGANEHHFRVCAGYSYRARGAAGQPISGAMVVCCVYMVCVPGLRPSMITKYPLVPDGNSSVPVGGSDRLPFWPQDPCAVSAQPQPG